MVISSSSVVEPSEPQSSSRFRGRAEHWLPRDVSSPETESALVAETLRLSLRYQEELVEAYNVCPWAKGARTSNNAIPLVDDGRPLLDQVDQAARLGADVVFLVLPRYVGSRVDLDELVAQLIAADSRRHRDTSPAFAMAAFHPEASPRPPESLSPETLVPYLRRSPDPTIQLVRLEALAEVRKGEPPGTSFIDPSQIDFAALLEKGFAQRPSLRQRVASANHALFTGPKGSELQRALDAILEDRRQTHRRLGLPASPWESA